MTEIKPLRLICLKCLDDDARLPELIGYLKTSEME